MKKDKLIIILLCFLNTVCFAQSRDLNFYISKGLGNSPLLKDYDNQAMASAIDSQIVKATYKPQLSASSVNEYAPTTKNGYGYDPVVTNNGYYSALLNVNQAFAGRRNMKAQIAVSGLQKDSIINQQHISEQDIKRTITAQYISAYGDLQQLNFNTEINVLLAGEDTLLKKLTQSNIYRQSDYLTFLVVLQQQQLQLKQLRIQYQNDLSTLNYLCGIDDTTSVSLAEPDIKIQTLPDISNSIFFRRYAIDSMRLENEASLLNYSYRPRLSAYANAGFYSSLQYEAYKNFGAGVGLSITMPIYDGRQRQLQYKKIRLAEDTRNGYQDYFIHQYNQQTAQLSRQLQLTEALMSEINEQIKYAETLIHVDGKLMQTGDTKIADFVIAINNYLTAKNLLTQNDVSRLQIINQLNYWNK